MRGVAVVPVRHGEVMIGGWEAVAEVADVADDVTVVVCGPGAGATGERVGAFARSTHPVVDRIVSFDCDPFDPSALALTMGDALGEADVVVVAGSGDGRDLAIASAHRLGRPLLAGALRVRPPVVTVWSHGGRLQRDVEVTGPFLAVLEPGVRAAPEPTETPTADAPTVDAPTVEAHVVETHSQGVVVVGEDEADPATVDLAEARRLVGVGAGLLAPDVVASLDAVDRFAAQLGASVGATRVVTDAGHIGHDRQIGTTGVVVDPDLYLAFAVSGAVQHTAGLGSPNHVVSVNTDPHCPMMAMADMAVVADANEVIGHLARLMSERTAAS